MLYIKNPNLARVTDSDTTLVTRDRDVALIHERPRNRKQRINRLVTIDEYRNRWQPPDSLLHLVNPISKPLRERLSLNVLCDERPGISLVIARRSICFCPR